MKTCKDCPEYSACMDLVRGTLKPLIPKMVDLHKVSDELLEVLYKNCVKNQIKVIGVDKASEDGDYSAKVTMDTQTKEIVITERME